MTLLKVNNIRYNTYDFTKKHKTHLWFNSLDDNMLYFFIDGGKAYSCPGLFSSGIKLPLPERDTCFVSCSLLRLAELTGCLGSDELKSLGEGLSDCCCLCLLLSYILQFHPYYIMAQ